MLVSDVFGEAGLVHEHLAAMLALLGPTLMGLSVPGQLLGGWEHIVTSGTHVVPPHLGLALVLGVCLEAVLVEAHYVFVGLVAHVTVHLLSVHVGDQVPLECLTGGEGTLAGGTAVRTLTGVCTHVHVKLRLALEPPSAFLALEQYKSHVEELVL